MENLKNWLNRNSFNFEVKEGFTGNELIFINVETLAAEQVKRIKTYLKRYKFTFEYRCNYTFILAYKEDNKINDLSVEKENKNSLGAENMNNKKELKPIFNTDIEGHEEYQKEELKKYNSGALNFTHKRINNNMIDEYTKYFIYKDNTFMSVKPGKDYPSGYYNHVRSYNYKVDHVNKIILFTDKEIEEVEPIKEEFYNNIIQNINIDNDYIIIELNKNHELMKELFLKNNIDINNIKKCTIDHLKGDRGEYQPIKILLNDNYITFIKIYKNDYMYFIKEAEETATEKENNQYITLTKEQEKERIELINLWSKKAPGDKEQGKEKFLHLLFKYQEQKKTKEELKKHINKLYAANKNIIEANKKKEGINNYLVDLLATEDILQQNNIIKNEFFKNAYNYIKSVS